MINDKYMKAIMIKRNISTIDQWIKMVALSFIIYHLSFSPAGAQEHSKYIQAVDEYRPAPGQWVNVIPEYEEGDTEADMVRKCTESISGD